MSNIINLALDMCDFYNQYARNKIVSMHTLGCKVNQYETDAMQQLFVESGYEISEFDEFADVYVINTCTVTAVSDKKSRQMIRKAKKQNPNAIIAVVGCYSQQSPEEVMSIEGVNLVMGTKDRQKIVEEVEKLTADQQINEVEDIMKQTEFERLSINKAGGKTRAFLKIQEGCDRFCSYCIIPYTRGPIRSKPLEDITEEVSQLAENGYKEIVLTGIHVASYGKDRGESSLIDVIERLGAIKGIERIRTSSVEPLIISQEFLSRLTKVESFCPHFHLSLQSGSDSVLKRMNRRYTSKQYEEAVDLIRKYFPDAAITTDVIVGFPGESEKEFEETLEFLKKINLYEMHIFKYSVREGTKAALMLDQVSSDEKNRRSSILLELSLENKNRYEREYMNKVVEVLFESKINDSYFGHTKNYIKVGVKADRNLEGQIKKAVVKDVGNGGVNAVLI